MVQRTLAADRSRRSAPQAHSERQNGTGRDPLSQALRATLLATGGVNGTATQQARRRWPQTDSICRTPNWKWVQNSVSCTFSCFAEFTDSPKGCDMRVTHGKSYLV